MTILNQGDKDPNFIQTEGQSQVPSIDIVTVKFLNFQMQENCAVIYLKLNKEAKLYGILSKRCKWNSKQ